MKITIETIPHDAQDYPTVGNWKWKNDNELEILVSDMSNWKYEFLVAYHELLEVMLCKDRNITQKEVDDFDINFENERLAGLHDVDEEPGYSENAPYKKEHFMAEAIERIIADQLNVDWGMYDKTVQEL